VIPTQADVLVHLTEYADVIHADGYAIQAITRT
jgi:hypothetical protein